LNILVFISVDKRVQFAVRHVVQHKSVCANVLRRLRQPNLYLGVSFRRDHIVLYFSLRTRNLGWQEATAKCDHAERLEHIFTSQKGCLIEMITELN
jgi:hypothetical protein